MNRRTAKEWIKNPSDELAVQEGCWFDAAAGKFVCDFLETFCRLSEGRWAGRPIQLMPWQRDGTMRLYGWKRRDGRRRFQSFYCEIAKKNGKSPWWSGLANYHLIGDGEGGPKVYLNACDREQARIVFEHAANMVRQSPDLASRLEIVESRHRIVCAQNMGVVIANSAVVDSKDGRNASLVEFDELHRLPDRKLWNVFQGSGASREQPLTASITTAGDHEAGVWYEQRTYSEGVESGAIPDTTHLGIVYRADPKDDVDDPATWAKANPSLGFTISEDQFRRDLEKAKLFPLDWHDFLRKRLNIVAASSERFLDDARWNDCGGAPRPLENLQGRSCWAGVDLSSVNDLTAVSVLFRDDDGSYDVHVRFYLPEGDIVELERRHKQAYRAWAAKGYLTLTPGYAVDYEFVRRDVLALVERHDLRAVFLDPANATWLYTKLRDGDGLNVQMIRQGPLSLNAPTKELLRLVLERKLRHGRHPILAWNAANAVATQDANGNVRLDKAKSRDKIDGLAATINALAAATADDIEDGESVYNSRGLLFF